MRMTLLSALFALGVGVAGISAANAAPAAAIDGAANASLVQQAQVVIVEGRRHCRQVRVCRVGPSGGRRCHWERVCRGRN
jgi:hypothetical protein